jgi:integrase
VEQIFSLLPREHHPIFRFLIQTGLRSDEACHLRQVDVDLERKQILIRRHPDWRPKGGKARAVPMLTEDVTAIVSHALKAPGPRLFARSIRVKHHGGPDSSPFYDTAFLWEVLNRVLTKLNLPGTVHCTRHTFATWTAKNGGKVQDLQIVLGHSNIKTTMKYYHAGDLGSLDSLQQVTFSKLLPAEAANKGVNV